MTQPFYQAYTKKQNKMKFKKKIACTQKDEDDQNGTFCNSSKLETIQMPISSKMLK